MKTSNQNQVTATTTLKKVLDANPKRVELHILNTSGTVAYKCSRPDDTYAKGYKLTQNVPYVSLHDQGAVYVVTEADTASLYIEEVAE